MRTRIFTEPQQGATYDQLRAMATTAESCGFDAFFRSDHYLTMGGDGLPGPTDSWVTLAGLARETSRIRLGTLVTSATFRLPGPLAISVAQVDAMSGGRVELGLGTGWYDAEHSAYGIPFPHLGERFDRLEEQLEIITGLWSTRPGKTYSFAGRHYAVEDSPALPKPVQPSPPIILGGAGPRRTPRLAARFGAEYNLPFFALGDVARQYRHLDAALEAVGRPREEVRRSVALVVCCGEDEGEVARRSQRIGREPAELRANGVAGTPGEVAERLRSYGEAGADTVYLQVLDLDDLDHIRLISEAVVPLLG